MLPKLKFEVLRKWFYKTVGYCHDDVICKKIQTKYLDFQCFRF